MKAKDISHHISFIYHTFLSLVLEFLVFFWQQKGGIEGEFGTCRLED